MAKILALISNAKGTALAQMATEALKKTSEQMGHVFSSDCIDMTDGLPTLNPRSLTGVDLVILVAEHPQPTDKFNPIPVYQTLPSLAVTESETVITSGLSLLSGGVSPQKSPISEGTNMTKEKQKKLIGITSCPTGIAHTFMAEEALKTAAEELGYQLKIETQGSVGTKNTLTAEDVNDADAVIIAADTFVDLDRFKGKPLYQTSTQEALHAGKEALNKALSSPTYGEKDLVDEVKEAKAERSAGRSGPYMHLMTGVSYMLPVVVAGGLMIALAFAFGGIYAGNEENAGTLGWALSKIGGDSAFKLIIPMLSAFIAFSIAQRPGIAPGIIGGMLATNIGAGFLGGIVSGFLAGYVVDFLNKNIKLPKSLDGLKPVLILPFLSTLIVGLLMVYLIGPPVKEILTWLEHYLKNMQEGSAIVLGLVLGAMMAFDMGGPVNKAAYTFGTTLIASNITAPMAAVMAAGMTPPLGLALAATLFKSRFTRDEHQASKAAFVLGISFITEGAIPFAARDPLRVIPCLMLGSAVAGALSMAFGCHLTVPHGGVFVLFIPNAVSQLLGYIAAILAGTAVTTIALAIVKKPLEA